MLNTIKTGSKVPRGRTGSDSRNAFCIVNEYIGCVTGMSELQQTGDSPDVGLLNLRALMPMEALACRHVLIPKGEGSGKTGSAQGNYEGMMLEGTVAGIVVVEHARLNRWSLSCMPA